MTVLANDTFSRSNVSSGFGTATDGQSWTQVIPTGNPAGTVSVTSNQGVIVNNNNDTDFVIGPNSGDCEVLVRFSTANSGDTVAVQGRFTSSSGSITCYKLIWYSNAIHINRSVANSVTQITSVAFTITQGSYYWLRMRIVGSGIWGKIWADGSAEPAAYTTSTTDTNVTGSGQVGILGATASSSGVTFDHFYAVDYPLQDNVTPADSTSDTIVAVPVDAVTSVESPSDILALTSIDTASSSDSIAFAVGTSVTLNDVTVSPSDLLVLVTVKTVTDTMTLSDVSTVTNVDFFTADAMSAPVDSIVFTVVYVPPWTVLGNDTFTRANNASSFGTATDGQTWSIALGSGNLSISSNEGQVTNNTTATYIKLGSNTTSDGEVLCRVATNNTSSGGIGVYMRQTASNTAYRCRFNPSTPSQGFALGKLVAGTLTTLTTVNFTMSTNTYYWIRFRVQGSNLYGKYWAAGTAEPAAWSSTTTDSSITGAGNFGLYDAATATSNIASYDSFYMIDNALDDYAVVIGDIESDVIAYVPGADSVTVSDVDNQATVVSLTDTALSPSDSPTLALTSSLSDSGSTSDTVVVVVIPAGMYEFESTPVTESVLFAQNYTAPIDALAALIESSSNIDIWINTDALVYTGVAAYSENFVPTENLTEVDSGGFSNLTPLTDVALTPSDALALALASSLVDTMLVTSDSFGLSYQFVLIDVTLVTSDSTYSSYPVPLSDDGLNTADAFSLALAVQDTWQGTLSEVTLIVNAESPQELALINTEIRVFTEQALLLDTTLSTSGDSLQGGIPANLQPDTLSITEALSATVGPILSLFTDQLVVNEIFFTTNNFTDVVGIVETSVLTLTSNIIDPRASLYQIIMSDAPTVYYQCNEDGFRGIYQRDGQDQPANASNPSIVGATLSYTWAQLQPTSSTYNWTLLDNDILPWKNQGKSIIIRVFTAGNIADNSVSHYGGTALQATPQWVFDAGAASVTGLDGVIYPVYWNATYQANYSAFVQQLALRYDTSTTVSGVVACIGVNGTTQLEASGDTTLNTLSLWNPRGYSNQTWVDTMNWSVETYEQYFAHTPIFMSVNSAFIVPDAAYNISLCVNLAVSQGIWLIDEAQSNQDVHLTQAWDLVPFLSIPANKTSVSGSTVSADLQQASEYEATLAGVWADDVSAVRSQSALALYAATATTQLLHETSIGLHNVPVFGEVYPTSHIETGDYFNGALQFNGINAYAMQASSAQATSATWSIKAEVFPTVLPTSEAIIVCNGQTGLSGYGGFALGIAGGSSGGVGQNFCAYLPGRGWYDSGYVFPQANQWYTCFLTFDGSTLSFFVNGVQTPNSYGVAPYAVPARFTVGAIWDAVQSTPLKYFAGYVDEIAIYNKALSATRIAVISSSEIGFIDTASGYAINFVATDTVNSDDSASLLAVNALLTDTALSLAETFASSVANVNGYTLLGQDNFNRANQSGWGTATDGQTWNSLTSAGTLSILNNKGKITAMSGANALTLGTGTSGLMDGRVHITLSTGTDATVGMLFRAQDANNYYRARLNATQFGIVRAISGTVVDLQDVAFTPSAGAGYYLRFRAVGSLLMAKYWIDTSAEPTSWNCVVTDSTYATGKIGLYVSTTTAADVYLFDSFFVVDNVTSDFITLSEQYSFTDVLPPFVDNTPTLADSGNVTAIYTLVDSVASSDLSFFTPGMVENYQLLFAPDVLQAQLVELLSEPCILTEVLLSTMGRTLDSDQLSGPADVSTVTNIATTLDVLSAPRDSFFTVSSFVPVDQLTSDESASRFTQYYPFAVEFVGTATDSIVPTSINLAIDILSFTESFAEVLFAALVDRPVVTDSTLDSFVLTLVDIGLIPSDIIAPTDIPLLSDGTMATDLALGIALQSVLIGADTGGDLFSLFIQLTLSDVALSANDSILGIALSAFTDTGLLSDSMSSVENSIPVESVGSNEVISEVLSSSQQDQTVPSDVLLSVVTATLPNDMMTIIDSVAQIIGSLLYDLGTTTDRQQETLLSSQQDMLSPGDSLLTIDVFAVTDATAIIADNFFEGSYVLLLETLTLAETSLYSPIYFKSDVNAVQPSVFLLALFSSLQDQCSSSESSIDALNITLPADQLGCSDTFASSSVSTFTGWTDILFQTEKNAITILSVPVEVGNTLESFTMADNALSQDGTLALQETTLLLGTPSFTENLTGQEGYSTTSIALDSAVFISTETSLFALMQAENEAMTLVDVSLSTTQNFEGDQCSESETLLLVTGFSKTPDSLALLDASTLTFTQMQTEVLSGQEASTLAEIFTPIDPLANVDSSAFTGGFLIVDAQTSRETLFEALSVSSLESMSQSDVSTLTLQQQQNESTSLGIESAAYQVRYIPVESMLETERPAETLLALLVDQNSVLEAAPSTGCTLQDITVIVGDAISFASTHFALVTGTLHTGNVIGILHTGSATGIVHSGYVEGILP